MYRYDLQIVQPTWVISESELLPKNTTLKAFQLCYGALNGLLTFRKYHAPSQIRELLAQWHIAEDMNATCNLTRIWMSQMSSVSFLHSALVVSLTLRLLYPSWRHPLLNDLGVLGRPSDGVDVPNRKFLF